ncbi:MAG: cytochrome c biogenesis protein CcsA [Deltaproteobacteria bacterium]|jgi:ABC-type transport system involved in cytochrome c biogenesis permease subunit|nr:cytochrome c biogenesis protein CcsA [Deltaproteobacteria bacterium]
MSLANFASGVIIMFYALGSLGTFWGIPAKRRKIQVFGRMFTLCGFCVHSVMVLALVLAYGADELSKGYFMQLLAWSLLLVYFLGWRWLKSSFLAMTAAPLALLLFILGLKLDNVSGSLPDNLVELFLSLHIVPMFLSLALLALAFGAGLLYVRLEHKIKTKARLSEFELELPALDSFDRINSRAVIFGFPLYTLALAAGFIWAPMAWGNENSWRAGAWDPKEIISLFVWFLYAALFHLRLVQGWRGRKAAKLAILIFAISVFSLVVVNFFMPTHHSFS